MCYDTARTNLDVLAVAGVQQAIADTLTAHNAGDRHLTAQRIHDIARGIVAVSVSGTGASCIITFTRMSGADPITLPIPDTTGGSGTSGGSSSDMDVHLQATGSGYSAFTQMLTLSLSDGNTVQIDMRELVMQVELTAALAAYAWLDGATFTNPASGPMPTQDKHYATKSYVDAKISKVQASTITQSEHIRTGWSADQAITDSELSASSPTNTVKLPTGIGFQYLALWRADADGGDPTEVHLAGGGNSRNLFGAATNYTYNSVAGKLIECDQQNVVLLGGEMARLV